jgi:aryl-alcohol dehydrogenase-like predicted oxidoreductase
MAVQTVPSERPFIFTKCGLIWDERNPMEEPKRVLRPESIRAECEASLRRLGLERIDLYQFHWPDETGIPVEDSWAEMLRLIQEGKVGLGGWIGAANLELTPADLDEIARHQANQRGDWSVYAKSRTCGGPGRRLCARMRRR